MATRSFCDGCSDECGDADLTTVGRYDPVTFCKDCLETWTAHEAAERDLHAQLVRDFQAGRAALRAKLKNGGAAMPTMLIGSIEAIERGAALLESSGEIIPAAKPRRILARLPDED